MTVLILFGCVRSEDTRGAEAESGAGTEIETKDAGSSQPRQSSGGIFGSRGRGSGGQEPGDGETETDPEPKVDQSTESELPLVELPLEALSQLPDEPRWARDARIGVLTTTRVSGDPEGIRATEVARDFLYALLAGESVTGDFYDSVTAETVTDRLRAECDGFRVGVAERLPQGEWNAPYRCLLSGKPAPLGGTLYVTLGDRDQVLDATVERLEELERVEPESLREQSAPF